MIVCENLVKIYTLGEIEVVALQGLDLHVQKGEMVGIVGVSGSGKSTLLNILGGLDRPSAGQVTVNGQDLLKLSEAGLDEYRRLQVGFVWQQTTRNLIPYLTALENIALPMELAGYPRTERTQRATELLELLGLAHRGHHLPAQLSGGQQQRVALGVALANKPSLLLADEPTGEVDSATAAEIYAALRKMNEVFALTTLIVSHDPNLSHHTDRVVAIRDGKTSTETVRAPRKQYVPEASPDERASDEKPPEFEELIVLDKAGRLQIPRNYLETLKIGNRVRLEMKENSLVIHPIEGHVRLPSRENSHFPMALSEKQETAASTQDVSPRNPKPLKAFLHFSKWLRKNQGRADE
ncbi:MAG: ABC transporter ATP-binding protein [Anaerolineales bacterium]